MSRPLAGSIRRRQGGWCASIPEQHGAIRRREERFATEAEARIWLAQAVAAVGAGRSIPDPVRRNPTAPGTGRRAEPAVPVIRPDIASVANAWMAAAYEDLRRGGPERAERVRRIVEAYLVPWFAPRTTTIADVTYFMAHEWLLQLVGRADTQPAATLRDQALEQLPRTAGAAGEVGLAEAARICGLSLPTLRRRWQDGQLPGAYRDGKGHIRVPTRVLRHVQGAKGPKPTGLSKRYVSDALWILRKIMAFARANGLFPPGFDPTEGLDAPLPDAAVARTRRPSAQPRPLSLKECVQIASHLHAVHQLVFWLQRIMGLRISEAFGLLVSDVVDLGETGMLAVQGQGGRTFQVRDDTGSIVAVARKATAKTAAGSRVLVVPATLMELLRVAIEAFHTDPDTGEIDSTARLVPGIHQSSTGGQLGYHQALAVAAGNEDLGTEHLGFRVSSHLLRKSCATDLAWSAGIEDSVRRRFMGHRAGEDVFGRIYTLDHPDVAPLAKVAALLDDNITTQITTLLTPTTRTVHWGKTNPLCFRADHVAAVLAAAGWQVDPGDPDDPLCDASRVADELRIAATTARRWMRDGTIPSVVADDEHGVPRRYSRLSEVWARRDQLAGVVHLSDLAEQLGVRYDEIYRTMSHLGLHPDRHPSTNEVVLGDQDVEALRAEHARVRALHCRAMKLPAAARQLHVSFTTARVLLSRGELELDPETDTSGARFVTRTSVEQCSSARSATTRRRVEPTTTVPFAEVMAITGLGRRAGVDLVRQGALEEVPGRRSTCEITTASLQAWRAGTDGGTHATA
ncbi:MAG: site-specific integrase [Actinomycetota bacterium]|nr:site-specific integrase [Actinomycetota bacterium]